MRESALCALKPALLNEGTEIPMTIEHKHFLESLCNIHPSVTDKDHKRYQQIKDNLRGTRGKINNSEE